MGATGVLRGMTSPLRPSRLLLPVPLLAAALVVLASAACSDDHSHGTTSFATCLAIVDACHPVDPGTGEIHECHEAAESATSDDACVAKKDACLALCKAAPPVGADAGPVDAASDAKPASDAATDAAHAHD